MKGFQKILISKNIIKKKPRKRRSDCKFIQGHLLVATHDRAAPAQVSPAGPAQRPELPTGEQLVHQSGAPGGPAMPVRVDELWPVRNTVAPSVAPAQVVELPVIHEQPAYGFALDEHSVHGIHPIIDIPPALEEQAIDLGVEPKRWYDIQYCYFM